MACGHKILLLDDDRELLNRTANSFARFHVIQKFAPAPRGRTPLLCLIPKLFDLLICDLKLPQMDGLQVLSIARRKFPDLRSWC